MIIQDTDTLCLLNTLIVPEIEKITELKKQAGELPKNVEQKLKRLIEINNQANHEIINNTKS